NPKTGETVSVSSHGVAAFRAGKELKRDVWPITAPLSAQGDGGEGQ
ncbi:MAG: HU family DNA-binding protein, partial [Breznakiellaceae bacterium]